MVAAIQTLVLSLTVGSHAEADAAFRSWVQQRAASEGRYVQDWWTANLDQDPAPERLAFLCSKDSDEVEVVIEKDRAHRWAIRYQSDGRTQPACNPEQGLPPWRSTKEHHFRHYQGWHHGGHETWIALREGRPAVIRTSHVEDVTQQRKPVVIDWDARVRRHKGRHPAVRDPDANYPMQLVEIH